MNLTDCVKAKVQNQLNSIAIKGIATKLDCCFVFLSVSRITAAAFYPFMELV